MAVEADKAQNQPEEAEKPLEVTTSGGAEGFAGEEAPVGAGAATKTAAAEEEGVEAEAGNGERRRGWADVMGMFHSRVQLIPSTISINEVEPSSIMLRAYPLCACIE
ncbi:hypothetical protein MUK42_06911 [Musa troglodytarum]|uniref:Uncharacterized protein n=1 Tax=Musa troglodytarum TaxID=320322 RepID=A0A9E7GZC5_9LILI|nr:hypothetical protein MUK42_06911 [Musa troglodytarum]